MTQPEKPNNQIAAPKSALRIMGRLIRHCFRLWLLLAGLVLWWQVLLWDLVVCSWPLLMQAGITIGDLIIPIGITLLVLIPPLLFGLNWLAGVAAGFGLYGLAHWLLRCACWFWSLPLLPQSLGLVLAQTQSAGYFIETEQPDKAETLYEQARSTFNKSAWRFCSGAAFGFLHYRKLLKKQGREQEAQALTRELRLPLLGQSACTALWFYSAAFIPMLLLNWFLRVYEDTNIKFYRDKPVKERLARLLPAVEDLDWLYLGRAKTLFYQKMGFLYESAHLEVRRTDPTFHLPVSARVNPKAAVRNSRADFLVEQYFWKHALETDLKHSGGAFQTDLLDHLDYCNSKLKMATSASNFLLDKAELIKQNLNKNAEARQGKQNSLETLVLQCLAKAREGDLSNRPLVEAAGKRWLEWNKNSPAASSRSKDNGLILAYVLTSYHSNTQALEIADCIAREPIGADDLNGGLERLLALADLYGANSEFARGRNVLRAAAKMSTRVYDKRQQAGFSAKCDLHEAKLCFEQQDYVEAERIAARAGQTLTQSGDNSSNQIAEALEQQATALAMLPGRLEQAISTQEKCLGLRTKLYGNWDLRTARTNLQLARMLRAASANQDGSINKSKHAEIKRAGNILGGIVEICKAKKDDNETALLYADTAQEAGYCARMIDDRRGAQLLFGEAAEIHMCLPGSAATRMQIDDLDGMAEVDAVTGALPMARTRVLTASGVLKSYVTEVLPQLSLAEQIAFNQTIEKHMNSLLAICQDDASVVDPQLLQAGGLASMGGLFAPYSHLLHWKGFLLEQLSLRSRAMNQPQDPSAAVMVTRHGQVCQEIVDSYFQPIGKDKLASLEQEKENLERQINEKTRNQVRQKSSESLDPRALQNSLADDEVLVDLYEFAPYGDRAPRYGAVISTNKQLRWVDFGRAEPINQALNLWRDNLSNTLPEDNGSRDITSLKKRSKPQDNGSDSWSKLHNLLAVPLSKVLPPTAKRVWISDESELCRLPWGVLLPDSPGMTNVQVCLVDSPRELLDLKKKQTQEARNNKKLLLVGGIDFGNRANALPGAAREIDLISKEASHFNLATNILSDSMGNTTASRQNVLKELVDSRYVHLATHGYFREESDTTDELTSPQRSARLRLLDTPALSQVSARNPLIDSGLLLSSDSAAGGGVLTAEDLLRTDLHNCKLVTLSACDTGRGRELSGQGVIGLRSALMGAGAHTILLSLWKVPDEATTELMKVFYRELLSGKSASDSLRVAQKNIRSQERWRAPRYWAGWVIVGNGWQT